MSEQVGDHEGSAPFKEGTIKYACYEVLKHAGPGGLTVRFGSSGTRANPSPRTPLDKFKKSTSKGVEFSYPSPPSLPSYQVAEIVHHIRDGCLAKLGGATPANTIVGQLSKGTRDVLLPGSTTPKKNASLIRTAHSRSTLLTYFLPTPRLRRRCQLLPGVQGDVRVAHRYIPSRVLPLSRFFSTRARILVR